MSNMVCVLGRIVQSRRQWSNIIRDKLGYATWNGDLSADWSAMDQKAPSEPCVVLVDVAEDDGLDMLAASLQRVKKRFERSRLVVLLPYGVEAMAEIRSSVRLDDVVEKPVRVEMLRDCLQRQMHIYRLQRYISWLERKMASHVEISDMVGESEAMQHVIRKIPALAESSLPVWIEGAAGTGKELFARALHGSSARAFKPLVVVDCAMLPEKKAEAVLFGGLLECASPNREIDMGKIGAAHEGSLLLKSVEHLPLSVQAQLHHFLHTGKLAHGSSGGGGRCVAHGDYYARLETE